MRLSKRDEYGLRATITLAEPAPDVASPVVMQNKEISQRGQTLLTLKSARLLHGKMDAGGGYYLARPAREILLRQIFRSLDIPSLSMAPGHQRRRFYLGHTIVRL